MEIYEKLLEEIYKQEKNKTISVDSMINYIEKIKETVEPFNKNYYMYKDLVKIDYLLKALEKNENKEEIDKLKILMDIIDELDEIFLKYNLKIDLNLKEHINKIYNAIKQYLINLKETIIKDISSIIKKDLKFDELNLQYHKYIFEEIKKSSSEDFRVSELFNDEILEKSIQKRKDFLKIAKKLNNETVIEEKDNPFFKYKFYYRGQSDTSYNLIPSVMRNNDILREDYFFHQIKTKCPESFEGLNHMNQLVKMQHYDCPTRLLDVTENPLVALYFACKNLKNEGCVYIFAVPEKEILCYDSDKAIMLSCLSALDYDNKKSLYDYSIKSIKGEIKKIESEIQEDNHSYQKFLYEIREDFPSFESRINFIDLLNSYFIEPLKNNYRIVNQSGAFILTGLSLDPKELEKDLKNKSSKIIIIRDKKKILEELDFVGINESSLFPEIDRVANYLKENN